MNTCGALGGWLAPVLTAYIAEAFGWTRALDFIALLSILGGLLWLFVNAEASIEEDIIEARTPPAV
jgi:cyanate permease